MISRAVLNEVASLEGLSLVSSLRVAEIQESLRLDGERLQEWQESGFAAEMNYMKREPALFVELERFLPNVKSVVSFAIGYNDGKPRRLLPRGHGKIARYAWGEDYHKVIPRKLNRIVSRLKERVAERLNARVFSDAVPILERSLAKLGSLGFIGKNTLLIRPGVGSFTFLGEILLDVEVEVVSGETRGGSCKSCFRCGEFCPTGAIVSPFSLDASKCISYLTIEKRTEFNEWEESAIGDWLFGCDICQDVCPFNHELVDSSVSLGEFVTGENQSISLSEVLSIRSDDDYRERFKGSSILRAKREQLLRNAAFVISNTRHFELIEDLKEAHRLDPSEMVRNSAMRAITRLTTD